jgi:hypothetical protein
MIAFADAEVDAARAAGCLIEWEGEDRHGCSHRLAYITDADLAVDLKTCPG